MDVRPSSSSLMRGPSWSLGFGADLREDRICSTDDEENENREKGQSGGSHLGGKLTISSPLPENLGEINRASSESQRQYSHTMQATLRNVSLPCPMIYVKIPTVFLTKQKDSKSPSSPSLSSSFHVYQIDLKTSTNAEWSVYKRYSHFLSLHQKLRSLEPTIGKFSFPPKRRLDSKTSTIVQYRRQRLEEYLQKVCDYIVKTPLIGTSYSYQNLTELATNGPSTSENTHEASDRASDNRRQVADETAAGGSIRFLLHEFISPKADQIDENESEASR